MRTQTSAVHLRCLSEAGSKRMFEQKELVGRKRIKTTAASQFTDCHEKRVECNLDAT